MNRRYVRYFLPAAISLATFLVYLPALLNDFVNFDDDVYVVNNINIRSLDMVFFKWAFSDLSAGFWHPVTWTSYAVDYALWGMNPLGFHLTAVILHTINTFLVVYLMARFIEAPNIPLHAPFVKGGMGDGLSPFPDDRTILITAGVTGLLFGLHPLHVESVAWVAERKDLLCALFFLLSIIAYTKYVFTMEKGGMKKSQGHSTSTDDIFCLLYCLFLPWPARQWR
jgi:protein O-mannosyl-transferase